MSNLEVCNVEVENESIKYDYDFIYLTNDVILNSIKHIYKKVFDGTYYIEYNAINNSIIVNRIKRRINK